MNYLAIVLIVKNEARSILEWLAFHAAVGVEHFFIYDNESTDGTFDKIKQFPFQPMISLNRFGSEPGKAQRKVYEHALTHYGHASRWMAFIDADEYLYSTEVADLRDFLRKFEHRSALAVHWLCFGSSGHTELQKGVINSFTRRAPLEFEVNRHVKSIVQTRAARGRPINPHLFEISGDYVRENDRKMTWALPGISEEAPIASRIRLNHYIIRSKADWQLKVNKTRADGVEPRPMSGFEYYDRNEVEDLTALRYRRLMAAYL